MDMVLIFLLGVVIGAGVIYFVLMKRQKNNESLVEKQQRIKSENMNKILGHFSGQKRVSNNDIENLLGVSDATAERYLEELERQGKIRQKGTEGRSVYYELNG